jgi:hypothetical protein
MLQTRSHLTVDPGLLGTPADPVPLSDGAVVKTPALVSSSSGVAPAGAGQALDAAAQFAGGDGGAGSGSGDAGDGGDGGDGGE